MSQLRFQLAKRVIRKLFSAVGLICVTATIVFSQQVQTLKTGQPVICDSTNYQLRLVTATTTIGVKNASALAIVLTPEGSPKSKVFGVYWVNNTPTYHDQTTGDWKGLLLDYGKGLNKEGQPVVNAFFSTMKCLESDAQVIGLKRVLDPETLPIAISLENVVEQLTTYGVQVTPDDIRDDSVGSSDLFSKSSNVVGFASAIRQYVTNLLAEDGIDDTVGINPTAQQEITRLTVQNKQLIEQKKALEEEKEGFLGAAPTWLKIAFPFMSLLSVGGLTLIGLAAYVLIRRRNPLDIATSPKPPTQNDSATNGKPASPTLAEREISLKLADLVITCNEIKGTVEKFDANVEQRFEGNRVLSDIWSRLHSKPYPKQLPRHFADDVGEVIQLYQMLKPRFGRDGDSIGGTTNAVRQSLDTLESIRKTYLASSVAETARVDQVVTRIRHKLEEDVENIRELDSTQQSAQQKLRKYHPAGNFLQTVDAVVSKADRAQEFETRSRNLQAQLDAVSSEVQAAEILVDEIILQLNFKTDPQKQPDPHRITTTLNRLRTERNSSPYLQLRMGLSAAMIALEKATNTNVSAEHEALIEALFLNNVKKSLKELLGKIEECSGDQLWTDVLYEGFNDQSLHYLIRADLLLRTYYSGRKEFSFLRKAVSLACTSILAALHDFQVEVVEVELFEKLPANMETEAVYPGVRNLAAVMDKVGVMVQNIKAGDVVVDVTSFPFVVRGVQENRGCASIANPSAWLQQ